MKDGHSKFEHGNGTSTGEALNKHLTGASKKMGEQPPTTHGEGQHVAQK